MKTKNPAHGVSLTAALTGALLLVPVLAGASGSSPMRMPPPQAQASPEQEAASLYNDGISYRDKAAKFEKEAAEEPDARKAEKLLAKARDRHESSIKPFQAATKKNPSLFQAWGSLGYAYRKVGNYPASLEAYAKALEIEPNYTPAIEYRAEAYLALNRLDEVKTVYITLFNMDRPRADELGVAIEKWLEKRKADPAGVDPAALADFSKWQEERKKLASQTSSLTTRRNETW
jgi:tetratricopeptide (TPR) repeat protein